MLTPPQSFVAQAKLSNFDQYTKLYQQSIENPEAFWKEQTQPLLWRKPWSKLLDWQAPHARWFYDGLLNVCENCLDVHALGSKRDKIAFYWEGESGNKRTLSYFELYEQVCQLAHWLEQQYISKGDRVLIYMPMVPEGVIAMLACARIGAIHSVVFGGFAADSIVDRLEDSQAKLIITADGAYRKGQIIPLKAIIDEALEKCNLQTPVLVFQHTQEVIEMQKSRDVWWHETVSFMPKAHDAAAFEAEHPLFILYTSGSTGKPKGILHSSAGYLAGVHLSTKYIFDLKDEDVYWCTADIGWITGHSYIVYGPLSLGATQVMYEGAPNFPDFGRFWSIIECYQVSVFYTAPTAIRAFIRAGNHFPEQYDLSSLRLLGSVGEPINPEVWEWYHRIIGKEKCPIVDTWWQTETGSIMITPLPGAIPTKPGSATLPFFGVDAVVLDDHGNECAVGQEGKLVIRRPWPSMVRTIYNDDERFKQTYWNDYSEFYTVGDSARRDEDGYFWIIGRIDDVLNVSGHRLGTAEIESSLVSHPDVAEAAVIGKPDELKGQAVCAFVTLKSDVMADAKLQIELRQHVVKTIGALARPDFLYFTPSLPKTRSGKIMRRLLKELITSGQVQGNITTLEDPSIIAQIAHIIQE